MKKLLISLTLVLAFSFPAIAQETWKAITPDNTVTSINRVVVKHSVTTDPDPVTVDRVWTVREINQLLKEKRAAKDVLAAEIADLVAWKALVLAEAGKVVLKKIEP